MDIGLDFDGVLADGARLKSAVLKERFGISIPPELCKRKYALQGGWVGEQTYERVLCIVYEQARMHELIPPIAGAVEAVRELRKRGHRLRIISARNPAAEAHVRPWLERHDIVMPVTCVGRFGLKTQACQGLDAYVDDDLVHLVPLKSVGRLFLFGPQPNPMPHWLPNGIRRVANWHNLMKRLQAPVAVA